MTPGDPGHPSKDSLSLRAGGPADADAISELIHSLSEFTLIEPKRPETAAKFFETISAEAIRGNFESGNFRYHVAESGGRLVGVIGILNDTHIYHLFVHRGYHRRGIARRLWELAREELAGMGQRFTVNASLFAVPLYEKFGFRPSGPETRKDGVVFLPMLLDEAENV